MITDKFYSSLRTVASPIVKLFFRIKIVGLENLPKNGGYILCCNHTHFMDVAFLVIAIPQKICFMAKQELFKKKLFGWFFRRMGAFPVIRQSGTDGAAALVKAAEVVLSGGVTGIFPEGTRSKDGKPKKAKSGVAVIASKTMADVVPVSIYYKGKLTLFKKVSLRIGSPIPNSKLQLKENDRSELRRVSGLIMDKITKQWGEGECL